MNHQWLLVQQQPLSLLEVLEPLQPLKVGVWIPKDNMTGIGRNWEATQGPRVNSVEECAKKVMETGPAGAKGAVFQEPGSCQYLMSDVVKGGPKYQSYTCIVFK